jgi:hypothetical protein
MAEETSMNQQEPNLYDQIEYAYEEGASDAEVCKILKVRPRDFEQKYQTNPAFRELIDIGRMRRKAYWMEQGRLNLFNPKFNRNLWLDFMKNEFGWADKSEVVTNERDKTLDEMRLELEPTIKKLLETMQRQGTADE